MPSENEVTGIISSKRAAETSATERRKEKPWRKLTKWLAILIFFAGMVTVGYDLSSDSSTENKAEREKSSKITNAVVIERPAITEVPRLPQGVKRRERLLLGSYEIEFDGQSEIVPIALGQCIEWSAEGFEVYYFSPGAAEPKKYTGGSPKLDRVFFKGKGSVTFELKVYGTCMSPT